MTERADQAGQSPGREIVFVCTGNTCRSPLAEALCKKALAERLGCGIDELPGRGYRIRSAGIAAAPGLPATPEAVRAAGEFGADLSGHRSRPVGPELLSADLVIAMTRAHADVLRQALGGEGPEVRLLRADGEDLLDPIGSGVEVYRECAETIRAELARAIQEWRAE